MKYCHVFELFIYEKKKEKNTLFQFAIITGFRARLPFNFTAQIPFDGI